MTSAVVVALGANRLEVPCLWFEGIEAAELFLIDLFGPSDCNGRWHPDSDAHLKTLVDLFFKDYYDGCGGIYAFEVRRVEAGQPIVCFDLD